MSTPGKPRVSSIPTPGRSRSVSSANRHVEYISLAEAIKANDPAHHRPPQSQPSTSSLSASLHSQSGRRSVTGRPSSAVSPSSSFPKERAKTPTSARPPSRHSDGLGKGTRTFDIGDNVRIESLGYEGTLRYIGEIDGKAGVWAGVELRDGFSGKGKNNGTVNG